MAEGKGPLGGLCFMTAWMIIDKPRLMGGAGRKSPTVVRTRSQRSQATTSVTVVTTVTDSLRFGVRPWTTPSSSLVTIPSLRLSHKHHGSCKCAAMWRSIADVVALCKINPPEVQAESPPVDGISCVGSMPCPRLSLTRPTIQVALCTGDAALHSKLCWAVPL